MRMRTRVLPLSVCLLALLCAIFLIVRGSHRPQIPSLIAKAGSSRPLGHKPSKLPDARDVNKALIGFEENRGQADKRVRFLTRGRDYGIFLGATDATIVHEGIVNQDQINARADASAAVGTLSGANRRGYSKIRISWIGANENAETTGIGKPQGVANYLLGNDPKNWQRKVPRYSSVKMKEIYPGIDLVYHGDVQRMEFDYVVAPHADPKAIQVKVDGPSLVSLESDGRLNIASGGDEVALLPPVAYQEIGGTRRPVDAKYVLTASHQFAFQVGNYDRSVPLIIDPVLQFAANFGGGYNSLASDVEVDGSGNIYLTGTTCATDYPVTPGAVQSTGGSNVSYSCYDIILTKLDPTASNLIYSTYLGGNDGANFAVRMLLDNSGDVTLIGATNATNYPTTTGAYQTAMNKPGKCDFSQYVTGQACSSAILTKVNPDGSSLIFSTLLGGDRADIGVALAVDGSGNYYVTGATDSTAFPTTTGAYSTTYGGGMCQNGAAPCFDVFISEISPDGTKLLASTYLGGEDDDYATSINLEGGNVFVAGSTDSNQFPKTHTLGTNSPHPGQRDVFVTKINPALTTLGYSTVIGGSADDMETAMKVDATGAVFFTGSTASTDFPVTTGSYQTTYAGPANATCVSSLDSSVVDGSATCGDVIVAKLSADGSALTWATLLGGSGSDFAYNLALDSSENVWVIGDSISPDFPLTSDSYYSPYASLFLSEISADGKTLPFSTSLENNTGGGGNLGLGIFIDHNNNVYVAGAGSGVSPTPGAYTTLNSPGVFVMEFAPGSARPTIQIQPSSLSFAPPSLPITPANSVSAPQSITVTNTGSGTLHLSVQPYAGNQVPNPVNTDFLEDDNCGTTLAPSANCTINVQYAPTTQSVSAGSAGALAIFSDAPGSPSLIGLSGQAGTLDSASFVPSSITFNGQAPGSTSTAQLSGLTSSTTNVNSIEVRTTGAAVVGGTNPSDFHVDTSQCALGSTYCTLSVTFAPVGNTPAQRTATVTVPSQAANSPQVLTLTGNVSTGPFISLVSNPYVSTPTTVNTGINGTLSIKNTGGATLTTTNMVLSGPNASEFVLSNEGCNVPAFTLTSGSACGFNVAFTPTAAGLRTATLTFTDNEATPTQVTLQGIATTAGGAELSEFSTPGPTNGAVLYPDTVVGNVTNYNLAFVTVLNLASGSGAGAHLTPTLTGDFQFTNYAGTTTCPVAPAQLTAGNSCSYDILFAPTAAGTRTGTLTIATDAPGNPTFTVNFSGNGVTAPSPLLSPTLLDFGPVSTGQTSAVQTLTLANKGNGNLTFGAPAIAAPFAISASTCTSPLAANGTCTISVNFTPTVLGSASGFISLATNAAGQSLAAALHGSGVTGQALHVSPSQLTFGNEAIGGTSPPQTVTLSNPGSATVTLNGFNVSENFTQSNNCGTTLAAGASCTLNVSFAPGNDNFAGLTAYGHIYIASTSTPSPLPISLVGTPQQSNGAQVNIALTSSKNPSNVGDSVTFTAAITSQTAGTITGTATFLDSSSQIGMPVTISNGMAAVTDTQLTAGNHTITVDYSGDSNYAMANSSGLLQTVNGGSTGTADFTIGLSPATLSLAQGKSGTSTITVTPSGGANFKVSLSCGTLPANVTCTPSPTSFTLDGTHAATSTLTIGTVAPTMTIPQLRFPKLPLGLLLSVVLAALLLWMTRFSDTKWPRRLLQASAILVLACGIASCGGGGTSSSGGGGGGGGGTTGGTTPGSYTIAITGAGPSGSPSHSANLSLTVTN